MDTATQPLASYNTSSRINSDSDPLDGSSVNISFGDNKDRIIGNRKVNYYWGLCKNLRRTEVALGCSVGVLLISCIILSAYIGVGCRTQDYTESKANGKQEICEESTCYEYAAIQSKMLDKSIDPCEDIYKYSCGRFHENFPPNPDEPYVNLYKMAEKKLENEMRILIDAPPARDGTSNHQSAIYKTREVFQKCFQNDIQARSRCGENPIFEIISKVGGWKVLETFNETSWSFTEAHRKIAIDFYIPTFFRFSTMPNEDNPQEALLIQFQETKQFIIEATNMLADEYYAYGCNISKPLGIQSSIEKFAEEVLEMQSLLQHAITDMWTDTSDTRDKYLDKPMDLAELSLLIPELELSTFIPELLGKQFRMRDEKSFQFDDHSYTISSVLMNTNNSMKHSYLIWTIIKNLLPHVPGSYWQAYSQILGKEFHGIQKIPPLWERCMKSIGKGPLGEVLLAMLIKSKLSEIAMNQINDVHANIRHVMSCQHGFIMESDNEIHNIVHNMINNFTITIGHSELLHNITKLDEFYNSFQVGKTHAMNMINLNIFNREKIKEAFTSQQFYPLYILGAGRKTIYLSPHDLFPFYNIRLPFYATYANIGWSIAHTYIYKIIRKYHELGLVNATSEIQEEIRACFTDILNGTMLEGTAVGSIPMMDYPHHSMMEDEDMTILVLAAKATFQAYQRHLHQHKGDTTIPGMQGLTHEQNFIVSLIQFTCESKQNGSEYGDIHNFRTNYVFRNLIKFQEIFNCPQPRNTIDHKKCNKLVADTNIPSDSTQSNFCHYA